MFKAISLVAFLLPFLLFGESKPQYGIPDPVTPTSTSSSSSAQPSSTSGSGLAGSTVDVTVAPGGSFVFSPANFTASNGTIVRFLFPSSGIMHSVTQSSLQNPCTPLSGGFDSGLTVGTAFFLQITDDSQPIYFMCKFPAHCGQQMVGTINAPTTGTGSFDDFSSAAGAIGVNEPLISFTGVATGGVGAVASEPPTTNTASTPTSGSSTSASSAPSPTASPSQTSGAGRAVSTIGELLAAVVVAIYLL